MISGNLASIVTFWARFYGSRNDLGNQVKLKYILTLGPVPSTEFRGGSCAGSQISWGPHICKVLLGVPVRRYMYLGNEFVEKLQGFAELHRFETILNE